MRVREAWSGCTCTAPYHLAVDAQDDAVLFHCGEDRQERLDVRHPLHPLAAAPLSDLLPHWAACRIYTRVRTEAEFVVAPAGYSLHDFTTPDSCEGSTGRDTHCPAALTQAAEAFPCGPRAAHT